MNDESISHRLRPRRFSWLTITLALLAVGTFIAIANPGNRYYSYPTAVSEKVGYGGGYSTGVPSASPSVPARDASVYNVSDSSRGMMGSGAYYPYPYPNPDVPVTDTREFLKVNYSASMQARDVQGLTRRVETTVRGYDGRIDQISSSPKYGYVSFAVPMSKYDAFRDELESLVDSRFRTINVSSQNLLPQKQSIEEQQKQADSMLADYKAARQRVVNAHASAVKSLQAQIDADTQLLATLRSQVQSPQVLAQIQDVSDNLSSLKQQMANENTSYTSQLSNADSNIKNAQDWQKAVKTQDQTLLDNVATVTGSVSLQWISYWAMAQVYLPGYWIPAIFAVLAFLSMLWDRRRFGTV
ncbi:MAG: hypothetical protein Q7S05_01170 [bacterium]|nr:hypothetical protein [bacterium]